MEGAPGEKGKQLKAGDIICLTVKSVLDDPDLADEMGRSDSASDLDTAGRAASPTPGLERRKSVSFTPKSSDSYLHGEGCMNVDLGMLHPDRLDDPLAFDAIFDECLFRICPQLSYTAQVSLQKMNKATCSVEQYDFAVKKDKREKKRNADVMKTFFDNQRDFCFGNVCQLQHVKTGKFVTAFSRTLAKMDKDAYRVQLVEHGDEGSWFQLSPLFKYRVQGKPIYHNDQITLRSVMHTDYFIQQGKVIAIATFSLPLMSPIHTRMLYLPPLSRPSLIVPRNNSWTGA
jgi:hypothetical protein